MLSKDFFKFLQELENNNHKDWFDIHRKRYEDVVKKPFEDLSIAIGTELQKIDPEIHSEYKKGIFRINRDIRFSKNKAPYKNNRSVAYSPAGKNDHETPGYYLEVGAKKSYLAGGAWCPSSQHIQKIRSEIYYNTDEFHKIIKDRNFKSTYGTIQGERSNRLPKDIASWIDDSEYIANKQFYFMAEIPQADFLKEDIVKKVVKMFAAGCQVNFFLRRAMSDII